MSPRTLGACLLLAFGILASIPDCAAQSAPAPAGTVHNPRTATDIPPLPPNAGSVLQNSAAQKPSRPEPSGKRIAPVLIVVVWFCIMAGWRIFRDWRRKRIQARHVAEMEAILRKRP